LVRVERCWAASLIDAHKGPWGAVGGAVENGKDGLVCAFAMAGRSLKTCPGRWEARESLCRSRELACPTRFETRDDLRACTAISPFPTQDRGRTMELIVLSAVGTTTLLLTELCGLALGHM